MFMASWIVQRHVDQVSCCLPVLRWFGSAKIVFYCHFPDQLLVSAVLCLTPRLFFFGLILVSAHQRRQKPLASDSHLHSHPHPSDT